MQIFMKNGAFFAGVSSDELKKGVAQTLDLYGDQDGEYQWMLDPEQIDDLEYDLKADGFSVKVDV